MSGHIGLREESRAGHLLAQRIARLFTYAVCQSPKRMPSAPATLGAKPARPEQRRVAAGRAGLKRRLLQGRNRDDARFMG